METAGSKGVTKINTVEVNYSWTIENFLFNGKKNGEFITSPPFSSDFGKTKWFMRVYPKGWSENTLPEIFAYPELDESKKTVVEANVKFSASCPLEKDLYQKTYLFDNKSSKRSAGFRFMDSSWINEYMVNDNLTINCKIRYGSELVNLSVENPLSLIKLPLKSTESSSMNSNLEKLSKELEKLMDQQQSYDITLVASGKKIQAHKVILSVRSPVFSALFSHDMKESREKLITIEDAKPDTVKEMLRFMYTGKVQNLDKLAYELLSLSDKYALDGLREMCEESLCNNITIENAVNILVLSDLHSAKILKKSSMTFIQNHASTIINSNAYTTLKTCNPHLIAELLRFIVSK